MQLHATTCNMFCIIQEQMSRDDEISVVFYKGKRYVYHTQAGCFYIAVIKGRCFDTTDEALDHANWLNTRFGCTEYGVRVYSKISDEQIDRELFHFKQTKD